MISNHIIKNILNYSNSEINILEIGCGEGDLMKYLKETSDKFDLIILYGVIGCFPVTQQRKIIDNISKIMNKDSVLWIGANIYEDSKYKFQTYPVPRGFYQEICAEDSSLELEEIEEKEIFGNVKYDKNQTTVLLTKNV